MGGCCLGVDPVILSVPGPQSLQCGPGAAVQRGVSCTPRALRLPSPAGPTTDRLCWLWFQIFGIFLAKTLISDIEAVKAGHHF